MAIPEVQHLICLREFTGACVSQAAYVHQTVADMIPWDVDSSWWGPAQALAVVNGMAINWWQMDQPINGAPSEHSASWGRLHLP